MAADFALSSAVAGADPMALAIDKPLVSTPAITDPPQPSSAAEISKPILAAPLSNDKRNPVSLLPCSDSVSAAPSASLVGGRQGHPRPNFGRPHRPGSSGVVAGRGRTLIIAPPNCPHPRSQPSKHPTRTRKSALKGSPKSCLSQKKFLLLQWNCSWLHANWEILTLPFPCCWPFWNVLSS